MSSRCVPIRRSLSLIAAVSIGIAVSAGGALAQPRSDVPTVATRSGVLAGIDGEIQRFLGIPFARPPVGQLRWRPPEAPAAWTGVRDASRFGAACMQKNPQSTRTPGVSEDCLTLNIWRPRAASKAPRAVMVWIYGGGFVGGSGSDDVFDGEALARKDVIVVTANYRVGVFGFLAHPQLTAESPNRASGNYGLMDQMAALHWVQENIASFGGDPKRVTVFGESAGASSLSHLIVSPRAKGLFSRAILQSPGAMRPLSTLLAAEKTGEIVGSDLAAMRAMPAAELLTYNDKIIPAVRGLTTPRALGPIADGWIVASGEAPAYRAGTVNKISLIIGGNADEGRAFVAKWPIRTVAAYEDYLRKNFGAAAEEALRLYPVREDADVSQALSDMFGDTQFHHGIEGVARGMAALGPRVYRYQFSHRSSDGRLPTHGAEIGYVFGNLGRGLSGPPSAADAAMSLTMMNAWVQFAQSGDPNAKGAVVWPPVTANGDRYIDFGEPVTVRDRYRPAQLDFLARFFRGDR